MSGTGQWEPLYEPEDCPDCGAIADSQIPVWEEVHEARLGESPDFVGCSECGTMRSVDTESKQ